ncbi:MAG: 50S ribosomal protein L29 [Fibrobacterota bacterium]|nr:50S ribosomal protein L29 [Fibrobacterota bacterium]
MAKAKARELREMAADVIATKVQELEANLFNMRFQASMGKLENTSLLQTTRRDIARAKTVLNQKSATGK